MATLMQENENSADNGARLPKIYRCTHCGEEIGKVANKYCNECTFAKNRQEMCEFNKKLMPNTWKCKMCGIE